MTMNETLYRYGTSYESQKLLISCRNVAYVFGNKDGNFIGKD